jgi:hypothetical protein
MNVTPNLLCSITNVPWQSKKIMRFNSFSAKKTALVNVSQNKIKETIKYTTLLTPHGSGG